MKNLLAAIRNIASSFTQDSSKPECVAQQKKSTPEADWARIRNCVISIDDPDVSPQRVTLRYAGEGITNLGAPVHIFSLPGSRIEVGVAPYVNNPQNPWVHYARGLSSSASLYVDNRSISIKREWLTTSPAYPIRMRRPSIA